MADVAAGSVGSTPSELTNVDGRLFFAADDGDHGTELWMMDGPLASPMFVEDIRPGRESASPRALANVGGRLFFGANDGVHGHELWVSDGSSAGTFLVRDINPSSALNSNVEIVGVPICPDLRRSPGCGQTVAFFDASDGATGRELWMSDGTSDGTVRVKDIRSGRSSSSPLKLTSAGSRLFFVANDGRGRELWVSDGTEAGTVLTKDARPGSGGSLGSSSEIVAVGDVVFFNPSTAGRPLWRSDGSPEGTLPVSNPAVDPTSPRSLTPTDQGLFFSGIRRDIGRELWRLDTVGPGGVGDIVLVKDIRSPNSSSPGKGTVSGDRIFFRANDGPSGPELWVTDGTSAGTRATKDIFPGNGNALNLALVASRDFPVAGPLSFGAELGGRFLFGANDGRTGIELWSTDGTAGGTRLVSDVNPNNVDPGGGNAEDGDSIPRAFVKAGKQVFFVADDGVRGEELWKTDGTTAGTVLVADLGSDLSSQIANLTPFKDRILFTANVEPPLYISDGTALGTVPIRQANDLPLSVDPELIELTPLGDRVLFSACDEAVGCELFATDGSVRKTRVVYDHPDDLQPEEIVAVGDRAFFRSGVFDDLWKTDGTASGTVMVSAAPDRPTQLTAVQATLFFVAADGSELWKSDGSPAGTTLLRSSLGAPSGTIGEQRALTAVGDALFFAACALEGCGLWRSDATVAGTVLVRELFNGPTALTAVNGRVFFVADDAVAGIELWSSDGTPTGTVVYDLNPGLFDSSPLGLVRTPSALFFQAFTEPLGAELWSLVPGS